MLPVLEKEKNEMDYVMTFILLFPDKVFHTRAPECQNNLPHQIKNCGFLQPLIEKIPPTSLNQTEIFESVKN